MGSRAIENRINRLKAIEAQQKALEEQAEAIKAEIKKEMESQGTEEIHTPNFIVRFKEIVSNKFDTNPSRQSITPYMRLIRSQALLEDSQ